MEIFKKSIHKRVQIIGWSLTDINPPILVTPLQSEINNIRLKPDVAQALGIAIFTLFQANFPISNLMGYYLKDSNNRISHLELRNLPKTVGSLIYKTLAKQEQGGFISVSVGNNTATVGLPTPVNVWKRTPIIEVG